MTKASNDNVKVLQILELLPHASVRVIADALGWQAKTGRYRADTARVHRALLQLAAEKKVTQTDRKRWVIVKPRSGGGQEVVDAVHYADALLAELSK